MHDIKKRDEGCGCGGGCGSRYTTEATGGEDVYPEEAAPDLNEEFDRSAERLDVTYDGPLEEAGEEPRSREDLVYGEMTAMGDAYEALARLDDAQRVRVLRWLTEIYHLQI